MKRLKKITFTIVAVVLIATFGYLMFSTHANSVSNQPLREIYSNNKKAKLPVDFIPSTLHVTAIGDSLTQGVGDTTNQGGYLKYLQEDLVALKGVKDVQVSNFGIKGQRSDQLLQRLKMNEVKESIKKADMVFITIGGNDIMKIVSNHFPNLQVDQFETELVSYEKRLNTIFSEIAAENPDATIVLIGLYNPFSEWFQEIKEFDAIIEDWNTAAREVVEQYDHAIFVNVSQIFANPDENLLYEDHFHPNNKGYERISKKVFSTILKHNDLKKWD